jgi:hypothetical protein
MIGCNANMSCTTFDHGQNGVEDATYGTDFRFQTYSCCDREEIRPRAGFHNGTYATDHFGEWIRNLHRPLPPLVFGTVSVGSSSSLAVTATNNNPTAAFQFKSAIFSGRNAAEFTATLRSNCASVAPGGVCSINVIFHPSTAGLHNAILTVKDSNKSVQTDAVSGTGQ